MLLCGSRSRSDSAGPGPGSVAVKYELFVDKTWLQLKRHDLTFLPVQARRRDVLGTGI